MLIIGLVPPIGVNESCMQLTAPVDVPVVAAAKTPHEEAPKRISLPSMLPPDWSTEIDWSMPKRVSSGLPFCSANTAIDAITTRISDITASSRRDCRLSLTR